MVSERRLERMRSVAAERTRHVTLLLEGVHDPHNVAAILRSADAFGIAEIHAVEDESRVKISNRIARGTQRWVDLYRYPSADLAVDVLKDRGYRLLGAAAEPAAMALGDWHPGEPTAFVFGNEHRGVGPSVRARLDGLFAIPMLGMVESLNVSVACAITLHHTRRRLAAGGDERQLPPADQAELVDRWQRRESMSA